MMSRVVLGIYPVTLSRGQFFQPIDSGLSFCSLARTKTVQRGKR